MPLTDAEKQRVEYHLGYPAYTSSASLAFGVPVFAQTLFLLRANLGNILETAVEQVRRIVQVMDGIDVKLVEAQDRLAATQLEELHLRDDEPDKLEREYRRWGHRLADLVGSPIYPYSLRYTGGAGGVASVPIQRGE